MQMTLSHRRLESLDKIRLGARLPQEQFEEYDRDSHIGSKAWHDQPIDRIGPLRLLFLAHLGPKWSAASHVKTSVSGSRTAQTPGSLPQVLLVATYD